MAWVYGLNAECGPSREGAVELARHFDDWPNGVRQDNRGNWWCWVAPGGVSRSGVITAADAAVMTATGNQLYERLRTGPPVYRYALVGVEADEFRRYDELLSTADLSIFPGIVLSERTWIAVGRPSVFVSFTQEYWWIPYAGEVASTR